MSEGLCTFLDGVPASVQPRGKHKELLQPVLGARCAVGEFPFTRMQSCGIVLICEWLRSVLPA